MKHYVVFLTSEPRQHVFFYQFTRSIDQQSFTYPLSYLHFCVFSYVFKVSFNLLSYSFLRFNAHQKMEVIG